MSRVKRLTLGVLVVAALALVGVTFVTAWERWRRDDEAQRETAVKLQIAAKHLDELVDGRELSLDAQVVRLDLKDAWGQPLRLGVPDIASVESRRLWSIGRDGIDEGGAGDDLVRDTPPERLSVGYLRVEDIIPASVSLPPPAPYSNGSIFPPPTSIPMPPALASWLALVKARAGHRLWVAPGAAVEFDIDKRAFLIRHRARGIAAFERTIAALRSEASPKMGGF